MDEIRWLAELPPHLVAVDWLDTELREALDAIAGSHANRKRATVLALAQSLAEGIDAVFDGELTCTRDEWYRLWRHQRPVQEALDLAIQRALESQRARAAAREAIAAVRRRAELADASVRAIAVLVEVAEDRGARHEHRTAAARALLAYADPELALREAQSRGRFPQAPALQVGATHASPLRGVTDVLVLEPRIDLSGYSDAELLNLLREPAASAPAVHDLDRAASGPAPASGA